MTRPPVAVGGAVARRSVMVEGKPRLDEPLEVDRLQRSLRDGHVDGAGRLARGVRNRLIEDLEHPDKQIAPFPVQAWFVGPLKKASMETNQTDLTSLYAGQSAPNLQHRNVASLMDALTASLGTPAAAA